ncbi:hypothetical protein KIW84_013228 [Lathyrus oleraceus]|uniref:Retrovirus-related Pol polyprotein from transposon TNT 1-94-like beta-barrel domain-containing protein n=1 Tax=Pisum sativum TaxID=3888 RepID=A0A9D5GXF1_PEA|nr:hypothetical protein KIW84_013228 [Pisum sativum]
MNMCKRLQVMVVVVSRTEVGDVVAFLVVEEENLAEIKPNVTSATIGHYQSECLNWLENDVNFDEFDESEELLLMAQKKDTKTNNQVWFLDSGCSNRMVGTKEWLFNFDERFCESIKLGDDSIMKIMGKVNLKLHMNVITQVITGIDTLIKKDMVKGMPSLKDLAETCSDCLMEKQDRKAIYQSKPHGKPKKNLS